MRLTSAMKQSAVRFLVVMSVVTVLVSTVQPTTAESGSWVEKASMPTGRYAFGAVTFNGTIYAISGLIKMPEGYKDGHITTTTNVN